MNPMSSTTPQSPIVLSTPEEMEEVLMYTREGRIEELKNFMLRFPPEIYKHAYQCACTLAANKNQIDALKLLTPLMPSNFNWSNCLILGIGHPDVLRYILPLSQPEQRKELLAYSLTTGNRESFDVVIGFTGNTLRDPRHGQWFLKNKLEKEPKNPMIEVALSPWCDECQSLSCGLSNHDKKPLGYHPDMEFEILLWAINANQVSILSSLLPSQVLEQNIHNGIQQDLVGMALKKSKEMTKLMLQKCSPETIEKEIRALEREIQVPVYKEMASKALVQITCVQTEIEAEKLQETTPKVHLKSRFKARF